MVPGIKQWGMQCVIEASSRRTVYCRAVWGRQGRLLHSRRVFLAEDLVDVNTVNEVSMADGGGLCWVKWLGSDKVLLLLLLSFSPPNLILLYFPVLHSHFFLPLPLKLWHGTALAFSLTRSALCRALLFTVGFISTTSLLNQTVARPGAVLGGSLLLHWQSPPSEHIPKSWELIRSLLSLIAYNVCLTLTNLWMLSQMVIAPIFNDVN